MRPPIYMPIHLSTCPYLTAGGLLPAAGRLGPRLRPRRRLARPVRKEEQPSFSRPVLHLPTTPPRPALRCLARGARPPRIRQPPHRRTSLSLFLFCLAGSGYDSSKRESSFAVGLKNVAEHDVAEVEARVHATMATLALDGFPREHVDAVVHQVMIPPSCLRRQPSHEPSDHAPLTSRRAAQRPRPGPTTIQLSIRPPHTSHHIARIAIITTVAFAVPSSLPRESDRARRA